MGKEAGEWGGDDGVFSGWVVGWGGREGWDERKREGVG
jgi:hypothetical protein